MESESLRLFLLFFDGLALVSLEAGTMSNAGPELGARVHWVSRW